MTSKTGRRRLRRVKICSQLWASILCFARRGCEEVYDIVEKEKYGSDIWKQEEKFKSFEIYSWFWNLGIVKNTLNLL